MMRAMVRPSAAHSTVPAKPSQAKPSQAKPSQAKPSYTVHSAPRGPPGPPKPAGVCRIVPECAKADVQRKRACSAVLVSTLRACSAVLVSTLRACSAVLAGADVHEPRRGSACGVDRAGLRIGAAE
jgi:hypothetical protein